MHFTSTAIRYLYTRTRIARILIDKADKSHQRRHQSKNAIDNVFIANHIVREVDVRDLLAARQFEYVFYVLELVVRELQTRERRQARYSYKQTINSESRIIGNYK